MGFAQAIEQQMGLVKRLKAAKDWGVMVPWTDRLMPEGATEQSEAFFHQHYREIHALKVAESAPFFVGDEVISLLEWAAWSMPACELRPELVPCPDGFVYFARLFLPENVPPYQQFTAIHWQVVNPHHGAGWVLVTLYGATVEPLIESKWEFGLSFPRQELALLATLWQFMGQSILATTPHRLRNRGAQKRAAKTLEHIPIVRVVELRRREYQQHEESHGHSTEWSCQWLVRGHWRQQFFPASGEHRPIWIAPHIKGPSEKPLKAPQITAYEVVR